MYIRFVGNWFLQTSRCQSCSQDIVVLAFGQVQSLSQSLVLIPLLLRVRSVDQQFWHQPVACYKYRILGTILDLPSEGDSQDSQVICVNIKV